MLQEFRFCPQCATPLESRERDGRARQICPNTDCAYVHWNNPTPVVAAIVQRGEDVLLVRNKSWPAKWYGLVTGFLEQGESPTEGILREVQEELGLQGELGELIGAYDFQMMNQIIIAYHIQVQGEVELGDELEDYKIVPIQKLRPWEMGTGQAVKDWLEKRQPTQ